MYPIRRSPSAGLPSRVLRLMVSAPETGAAPKATVALTSVSGAATRNGNSGSVTLGRASRSGRDARHHRKGHDRAVAVEHPQVAQVAARDAGVDRGGHLHVEEGAVALGGERHGEGEIARRRRRRGVDGTGEQAQPDEAFS